MGLFSNLFSGINTTGLCMQPTTIRDLLPVSLYCDTKSYELVVNAYNDLFEGAGQEKVTHLNSCVNESSYWGELFTFVSGPFWGLLTRPISAEEANLVSRIGSNFFYDPSLGMLISKDRELIFINVKPSRRSGIFLPGATIETGINIDFARKQMARDGWKTEKYS